MQKVRVSAGFGGDCRVGDEGAGGPWGPIKGRAGILGRRAVEGAGENLAGELGFCWSAGVGKEGGRR